MASVSLSNVTCRYPGAMRDSVSDLNLDIHDGEFLVLVGPSGCGKSTVLRMLAGLEEVSDGRIWIGDRDATPLHPKDRDIAMVFRNYALYPHLTVRENIGFPLKIAKFPKAKRDRRIKEAARLLDLTDYLDRRPKALSGGQRQRVAMGRAIVRSPEIFLMDEPLSNLDAKLRVQTRSQISELTEHLGVTTVYVTHDQTEAMTMGDRVAVLKDGRLQQVDTPANLYDHPANEFVAGFIGSPSMNVLSGTVEPCGVRLDNATIEFPDEMRARTLSPTVHLGIRPEDLEVVEASEGFEAQVELVEELGADAYVHVSLPRRSPITIVSPNTERPAHIIVRTTGRSPLKRFDRVWLAPTGHCHFFDSVSGHNLAHDEAAVFSNDERSTEVARAKGSSAA